MRYLRDHFLGSVRNGTNLVSLNLNLLLWTGWEQARVAPVKGTHYPSYPPSLFAWLARKKVRSVRLLFSWEAVQVDPMGAIKSFPSYWTDLTNVLNELLARNIYVTLAPWQQDVKSATNPSDTGIKYRGLPITEPVFADFWSKFSRAVSAETGNDQRVAFELINEPHAPDVTLDEWFTLAQVAIDAIRAAPGSVRNTILVPGMNYDSAAYFVNNGSAAKFSALTDPEKNLGVTVHCYPYQGTNVANPQGVGAEFGPLVNWARTNGVKVHVGEVAIDAGEPNGNRALADQQWQDWAKFCVNNSDVLVGWNWWATSVQGWWGPGDSSPDGRRWPLTLDSGGSNTTYMDVIESSIPQPFLTIRDDLFDTGKEPHVSPAVWESPDVWVRQSADGGLFGDTIVGGVPCVIYVKVTNTGERTYPASGTDHLRLFWCKAATGALWPAPWDGTTPAGLPPTKVWGGPVAPGVTVGEILPGQSKIVAVPWTAPNPQDYAGDSHFCLLATIGHPLAGVLADFSPGLDLAQNVVRLSNVAWRNIHIIPVVRSRRLGLVVVSNHTKKKRRVRVRFRVLDAFQSEREVPDDTFVVEPVNMIEDSLSRNDIREKMSPNAHGGAGFELTLESLETRFYSLSLTTELGPNFGVRAIQYFVDKTGTEQIVGGQTFVVGEVDGFTRQSANHQPETHLTRRLIRQPKRPFPGNQLPPETIGGSDHGH
jgi:endoglucanase